jgi:hypothetical protein
MASAEAETDRKRILDIMKDSRIGTYGVLGLVLYVILLYLLLSGMSPLQAALTVIAADPFCKMLTAQLIQMLPYARTEETAKNGVVYRRFSTWAGIGLFIEGCLPLTIVWILTSWGPLAGLTTEQGIAISIPIDVIFFPGIVSVFSLLSCLKPHQRLHRRLLWRHLPAGGTLFLRHRLHQRADKHQRINHHITLIDMKVTLIRHTRVGVPQGTCYGWSDVPLAETFEQEAAPYANEPRAQTPLRRRFLFSPDACPQVGRFLWLPTSYR